MSNDCDLYKEYHWLSNGKELEISLKYNRDTYNYFNGTIKQKGYEGSYTPCKRGDNWIEMSGSDPGSYELLIQCDRKSKKREAEALAALKIHIPDVVAHFEMHLHPNALTYEKLMERIKKSEPLIFDASGIDKPSNWLWEKQESTGIYYPTVKIIGKTADECK